MKKTKKIILISILSFVFIVGLAIGVFAYYEYYGQYASILNIDGTIKLDAFDVLYPELREDTENDSKTYGRTPENPYVIDSVLRLRNLIRLNNSGKLQRAKEKNNVEKYYFCLEFDEQELAQVLNLAAEGTFQSIGNNEYPFVDELSGLVYSYNGNYYSGCLEKIVLDETTSYNGVNYAAGTYYKVPTYDANHQISSYSYVLEDTFNQNYTKVHQIIANETIEADDTQLDIGFISRIGATGYVHDVILYNINVNCVEEAPGNIFDILKDILIGNGGHTHKLEDATNGTHERHIGVFAGHIDGAAANISVAGTTNININTERVNYYSNYTTVGHIDSNAFIGGIKMSELETDSFLNGGSVSGCLFADNIYQAILDPETSISSTNSISGANYYKLVDINDDLSVGWQQIEGNSFAYGAFTFMLSSRTTDVLSTIWRDADKAKKLLGLTDEQYSAYYINQSVLYCSDEYRFSEDATSGGSIIRSSASVAQGLYAGIRPLDDGGSVVDAGKYLIVAKIVDSTRTGGYAYYALKLTIDGSGDNLFDTSDAIDITNYILDTTGNEKVYQSCIWEVPQSTSTPIFKNNRWDENYLGINASRDSLTLEETSSNAKQFQVNMKEDKFYYTYNDGTTNTVYYLNFNAMDKTFSLSTDADSTIQLYRISNGFNLEQVSSTADIMDAGDYIIVAKDATNSYLLGIEYSVNSETHEMQVKNSLATPKSYANASFPTSVTLSEYNEMINYIWYTNDVSATGVTSFEDKVSMTYFIGRNNNALAMSTVETYWTYNGTTSGSLANGGYYINYSNNQFGLANGTYTLYLYKLVPQDETPLYISYEGARHLDANSTELKAGDYVIVANDGGTRYPLGLSNATTINNTVSSVTISDYSPTNSYLWTISEDTYTPRFVNKQYSSSNLYTNGSDLSGSTTNFTWYYDAIESRLYTEVEGNKKYISYDSTNGFVISGSMPTVKIELYKNEIQHDLTNISLLTSVGSFVNTTNSNNYYFISYYNITDVSNAPVLMEWNEQDILDHRKQRSNVDYSTQWNGSSDNYVMNENPYVSTGTNTYYELATSQPSRWDDIYNTYYRITATAGTNRNHTWAANTWYKHVGDRYILVTSQPDDWNNSSVYSTFYRITATAGTNRNHTWAANTWYRRVSQNSGSISTTDGNILKALWGFEGPDTYSTDSGTTSGSYSYLYNKYFQDNYLSLENGKYANGMSGYTPGKLYLSVDDSMNVRSKAITTKKIGGTVPNYNSGFFTRVNGDRLAIYFIAASNEVNYALYIENSNGVLSFKTKNSYSTSNNVPYIYRCDYKTSFVLTLVSSDGEKLDNNINYVIAAKSNDNYYGLSFDSNNASEGFTGYDVTTYINPIMNSINERIEETVNVPKNSDWTCVANNSENMFYQTAISTNNTKYYLDSSGTTLTETMKNTGESTADVLKLYYDSINKVMKCIKNSTTYYLIYRPSVNKFELSNDSTNAAEIHLFRYDASYSINIITDYDNVLMDGDFMIAAHSVDGWQAIGSNGSSAIQTDVTNKLTDTISEEDYKSLLDYIYHQYQYSSTSAFNSDKNSGYFIFQNFNLSETGSIAYKSNRTEGVNTYLLVGDAAPYQWKVSRFSDGTWKLLNNMVIGYSGEQVGEAAMNFHSSSTTSSLTISQNYKSINSYLTISGISTGSPVAIFNYSNGQLGELLRADSTGVISFTTNNQYVIAIMNSSKTYSLIGFSGNAISMSSIGKSLNRATIEGLVNGNNTYVLTADSTGDYGHSLKFAASTNYYLNSGSNTPTAATTKQYFEYSYNHVYTEQSRLCQVVPATASGNLDIRGNQVISGGSTTYLYDHTTNKIATTLQNNRYYSILIFKDHKYYIVSLNNANNVVPITYGSGLPSTFASNEKWLYSSSNFTMNGQYLGMGTDGGLDLFDTAPTISWNYSGSISGTGTFGNTRETGSSVGINNNYGICLFHIRKSDALSATADVESALNYKAEVISSLSIMDSENYIIVAEANGRYYALTMMTKDSPTTIDITDEFSDALNNGYNISIYEASVWEQLGKDYSLVFANQGFANKYIKNEENYEFSSNVYDLYEATFESDHWTRGELVTDPVPMKQYILIKYDGNNYSTCLMGNKGEWSLEDKYEDHLPATVDKLEVYTYYETVDDSYVVSPYDAIIYLDDKYLLDGDITKRALNGGPTTTLFEELPDEMEDYTWTVYPYGTNQYVIGNYDEARGFTSYLYFDLSTYSFQFTTDIDEAKELNKKVQVYRLGEKQENDTNYQTFEIAMNEDGFTIDSLPLTEVEETDEVLRFSNGPADGTISGKIDGEYVIMAKAGNNYYGLTTDANGNVKLADLSLMFSGNFLIDTNGNYCLSINTKYIWKQMNTPTVNENIISNLNFQNYAYTSVGALSNNNFTLNLNGVTYDLENHRLYNGSTYVCYSRANGFTLSNSYAGSLEIYLYSLGTDGIAVDENSDIMQYTYYSFALNTSAVDYSYFKFNKMLIPNLPNIKLDGENVLITSRGWKKTSTSIIEEVNDSVYFEGGINYSSNMTTEEFATNFEQVDYDYTLDDESRTDMSISYYAPKGATSIAITEASPEKPVFVNVVVSTELNEDFDETLLRYLCLWRIADLDGETGTIQTRFDYSDGQTNSKNDYAYSLSQKYYTPYAAIPLPNCYSTATKQSSYVKVLNADGSDTEVYYLKYINYEHLLAHTYTITSPGIYYLGATYGTVTFCYVSIDNMMSAEDSEDNTTSIAEDFSIDFVWGDMGNTGNFGTDSAVGDITYVGRKTQDDEAHTWVNSNIHPKFVNGDALNPTDYLQMTVVREYTAGISTVVLDVTTSVEIYDNGKGIMYVNSNSTGQRAKRKVDLNITIDSVGDSSAPVIINKNVVSFDELSSNSIQTAYYKGTAEEWEDINNNDAVQTVYYYSSNQPESNVGSYWHYDENNNPVVWTTN